MPTAGHARCCRVMGRTALDIREGGSGSALCPGLVAGNAARTVTRLHTRGVHQLSVSCTEVSVYAVY